MPKTRQNNLFANTEMSISQINVDYQTNKVEEQSIASSRGSAWPSSMSKLTPFNTDKKASKEIHNYASIVQQKQRKSRKDRQDPGTEIKRVPYKINLRAESDMFEDISGSMEQYELDNEKEEEQEESDGETNVDHL